MISRNAILSPSKFEKVVEYTGNTTITHCRPAQDAVRRSLRTLMVTNTSKTRKNHDTTCSCRKYYVTSGHNIIYDLPISTELQKSYMIK